MPIPPFNEAGLLPPGVYDCTLEDVRIRLGMFQASDRRSRLFAALQQLVAEIRNVGIFRAIVINGSFVTNKSAPNDIDLILVLPAGHNFRADLSPNEYNLVSARAIHRRFGFDALVVLEGKEDYTAALELFQQVRDKPGTKKGLVKLNL